jgi:hypothetical protein
MASRRYRTEFAVNIWGDKNLIMHPSDFPRMRESNGFNQFENDPLRIYMICARQRITYSPSEFQTAKNEIRGTFRVQIREEHLRIPFTAENPFPTGEPTVECPYPHTSATFRWPSLENRGMAVDVNWFARRSKEMREHLALEVLYIGKSYGTDGSRTAPDRLENHATLQSIQAHLTAEAPDKDIWLLFWSLNSRLIACIDGQSNHFGTSEAENDQHVSKVLSQAITEEFETALAEAALIRYFQPQFNKQFTQKFPHRDHRSYSECYEWDLNTIAVEIDTEELGTMLASETVAAGFHHTASYPLNSETERRALFDFS